MTIRRNRLDIRLCNLFSRIDDTQTKVDILDHDRTVRCQQFS